MLIMCQSHPFYDVRCYSRLAIHSPSRREPAVRNAANRVGWRHQLWAQFVCGTHFDALNQTVFWWCALYVFSQPSSRCTKYARHDGNRKTSVAESTAKITSVGGGAAVDCFANWIFLRMFVCPPASFPVQLPQSPHSCRRSTTRASLVCCEWVEQLLLLRSRFPATKRTSFPPSGISASDKKNGCHWNEKQRDHRHRDFFRHHSLRDTTGRAERPLPGQSVPCMACHRKEGARGGEISRGPGGEGRS